VSPANLEVKNGFGKGQFMWYSSNGYKPVIKGGRMTRTKIVCTLGPSTDSEERLREMIRAGMSVARINFSHGDHEIHARRIALVRRLAEEEGKVVAILGDLQGPKLRTGSIASGSAILREGAEFILTTRPVPGDEHQVHFPHPEVLPDIAPGHRILLDDGLLELQVLSVEGPDVRCRVLVGGELGSNKGVTLPGVPLRLPPLTEKDREDVRFAVAQEVDYLALSFVRRAGDVTQLKELLQEMGIEIPIVAKIEKQEALDNFAEILEVSDGIMIARGDLGVEIEPERVPLHQKTIIRRCREKGIPVITATQMLESMRFNPRPTRAEASDVANAIFDGTDALMLSGETAIGKYPVEAVRTMARIAEITESALPYHRWLERVYLEPSCTVTDAIGQATCEMAMELGARAIITSTVSGYTARMVARHRPATPIIATTPDPRTYRRLALVWGVQPLLVKEFTTTDEMISTTVEAAVERKFLQKGDLVIITAGIPVGGRGRTNMIKVHRVGYD